MDIQNELTRIGTHEAFASILGSRIPLYDTPVSARENLFLAMEGRELWTPVSSEQLTFTPRIIPDNIARGFVLDADPIDNDSEAGGLDMFGVNWEWIPQVDGSMVRPENEKKLKDIAEWETSLAFPDPSGWDWEGSAEANLRYFSKDLPVATWLFTGLFERLVSLMGFGEAAIALVDEEEKPHVLKFFDRLCSLYEDIFTRFKKYYDCDLIHFHDDWGGQYAPFFSLETVREMLLPSLKRLVGHVHGLGMIFEHHSCGKVEILVPAMAEAGVDIWAGQNINDYPALLEEYGPRLRMGVMPKIEFGLSYTAEEAEEIAKEFLKTYDRWLPYIRVQNFIANDEGRNKLYEIVYEYTRRKFSR